MLREVARTGSHAYLACMSFTPMTETPAFLDSGRPAAPDIVVPRGVTPFYLPRRPVRGRLMRLGPLADALLTRHDNHPAVTRLAGEALALAAALATALKFRGSFSVQAKGDGAVPMLLADCTDAGALRGYARSDPERLADAAADRSDAVGAPAPRRRAISAFTVDQGPDRDRHQGIVTIEGDDLAEMALHYFRTSEQLRCAVRLACRAHRGRLARRGARAGEDRRRRRGIDPALTTRRRTESWRTATTLAATLTDAELLDDALSPGAAAVPAVPQRGRRDRPRPRAVLWLPLLTGTAVRHPGRFRPRTIWTTWRWTATS